jgi:glycosyltransferase involved in cell wall biosynthesis
VPWVWFYERQYLREVDIVHVQTSLERIRVDKIIGKRDSKPEIVVAQNGRKTELENVRYQGHNSKRILLMTHLDGGRAREAKWFIEKVWPLITVIEPEASLLLVGRPPKTGSTKERELRSNKNVKVLGFVDDFGKFLESISIMVVPTLHGTGLVNRVLDALCAGIPIVACPEPLSTITGLIPGKHALSGSNAKEFAEGVLTLLSDPTLRKSLSSEGRKLAKTQPTWHETIERIDMTIRTIGEDCTL